MKSFHGTPRPTQPIRNSSGAALAGLVLVILIMGGLAGVMVSLSSGSLFSNIGTLSATRAIHFAQSGYRHFALSYQNADKTPSAKTGVIQGMHGNTYTLTGTGGQFTLAFDTYFYTIQSTGSIGPQVTLSLPGALPEDTIPTGGGFLAFPDDSGNFQISPYTSAAPDYANHTVKFNGIAGISARATGDAVFQAGTLTGHPESNTSPTHTLTLGEDITVSDLGGFLPPRFGMFCLPGDPNHVYGYRTSAPDTSGTAPAITLEDIFRVDDPDAGFKTPVAVNDRIVVHSFANVKSTGIVSAGNTNETRHTFSRYAALGFRPGGMNRGIHDTHIPIDPTDKKKIKDLWMHEKKEVTFSNNPDSSLYDSIRRVYTFFKEGDDPLTDSEGGLVSLNWYPAVNRALYNLPDLAEARLNNEKLLTYDVQVKFMTKPSGVFSHFMVGINFRLDMLTNSTYGISLFRSDPDAMTSPPKWLTMPSFAAFRELVDPDGPGGPKAYPMPFLVLWKRIDQGPYEILAHTYLPDIDVDDQLIVPASNSRLVDWITLAVSVEESFKIGTENRMNTIKGYLASPLSNPDGYGEIHWDMDQFIKADWEPPPTDDSLTSENFDDTSRPKPPEEIGIHGFDDTMGNNKLLFTDFAIRVLNPGPLPEGGGEF